MRITIPARCCGPSSSGNGGWTAGSLAQTWRTATRLPGPVTVRLSAPPPLGRPLDVVLATGADEADDPASPVAILSDGGTTVATAAGAPPWTTEPVTAVSPERAASTASSYVDAGRHPFPRCVVCGPARERGDGLRLAPGRLGPGLTACCWRPADLRDDEPVTEPWVWAALDCPGGWTSDLLGRPMVLGTMTAEVLAAPAPAQTCVVVGRLDAAAGRRTWTSTALYAPDGTLLARAEGVWIAVDPATFGEPVTG